jgi:hypothetical protein
VSPGDGKTTCSFITRDRRHPVRVDASRSEIEAVQDEELSSAPPAGAALLVGLRPRDGASTPQREDGALRRLTNARGYDAEASYSPDGQWIVFSSMRDAYDRPLTPAEQKQLETTELLRRDLHHARRSDGRAEAADQRRRYDGGPFFSPDGKRIIWRAFDEPG